MPFKLRLKKTRHYNVVSKSLFVICVELLDGSSMECTLTAESVGNDCLDNVCQRLGLQQPEFFGLRYISRHNPFQQRWVELDKPLKRQLDKFARERNLLLRVMYYMTGVSLLHDETTRYHYFLQLKMDVIEGRMNCDPKQAVMLASYSMQAEFGNHEPEKHTAEYLKDFALFPKHIIEEGHLESLTEAVILQHASLAGLPQGTAEEYYILAAQQLDGYGQEIFDAKDEVGVEVVIGISLTGIVVGYEQAQTSKFYRWNDITNVVNHKKCFSIECQEPDDTVQFQFSDAEIAKYVWRMCVHQHTFFTKYEKLEKLAEEHRRDSSTGDLLDGVTFRSSSSTTHEDNHLSGSREELDNHVTFSIPQSAVQRAQSTSCLDLTTSNSDVEKLRALLPSYRPAPDYETAVQHKYHHNTAQRVSNVGMRPNRQMGMLFSSQPEIHQQENLSAYNHYPDVARVERFFEDRIMRERPEYNLARPVLQTPLTYSTPELDTLENHISHGLQLVHLYKPPPPYPINRPSSNSTPDLASQGLAPPRPGFITAQVSGSSPDLVSSRNVGAMRHHARLVRSQLLPNPEAHRTYTNLATALDPNIIYHVAPDFGVLLENAGINYQSQIQEPIYENVPLPWIIEERSNTTAGSENVIRSRASSVQSAPEMSGAGLGDQTSNSTASPKTPENPLQHSAYNDQHNHTLHQQLKMSNMKEENPLAFVSRKANIFPGKREILSTSPSNSEVTSISQGSSEKSDSRAEASPTSNSSFDSDKQKPRKKWQLLVGGKIKSRSSSKSETTTSEEKQVSVLKHRWSTGLPRLPLPTVISKETMCQLLERKLVDSQLFFEFEKIPKKKSDANFSTALHEENNLRNRFKDVLPYEENRVRLTPSKENKFGYINASYIPVTIGTQQRFYIAAQSPMPNTVVNFWQMIWETNVYLVVMCGTLEEGISPYSPPIGNRCLDLGEFQIWQHFSQETGHCVTSKLRLLHTSSRHTRNIWHLQYSEWGDHGCPPNVRHFLGFLEELSSVRQHTMSEIPAGHSRNPPVLVHCSAGVGRTGVVITGDLLLHTLDHNQELDIPRVVSALRHQRMLMVQTLAQYRFIYNLLIHYLKHSRLI